MTLTNDAIITVLRRVLVEMLGSDFDHQVLSSDRSSLVYDMGLESLECVALIEQLERAFELPAGSMASRVIREESFNVAELSVGDLVACVQEIFAKGASGDNVIGD